MLVRVQDVAGKELENFFQQPVVVGIHGKKQAPAGAQALGQGVHRPAELADVVDGV